jgi:fibronectin type 3 domain-containing protein
MKKILSLVMVLLMVASSFAVTFQWDASPDPTVVSYKIYFSTTSGTNYTKSFTSTGTSIVVDNKTFQSFKTNYAIVVAVSNEGVESDPSNEVPFTVVNKPGKVQNFKLISITP